MTEDGGNSAGKNFTGINGKDIIIEVPLGTIAKSEDSDIIEAEILNGGKEIILIKGERGGYEIQTSKVIFDMVKYDMYSPDNNK